MTLASKTPKRSPRVRNGLMMAVVALPLGVVFGKWLRHLETQGDWSLAAQGWSDVLAILIAALLVATGLTTLIVSVNRRALGKQIDPETARLATPAQSRFYAQQGLVMVLGGVMLAAPVLAEMLFAPIPQLLAAAAMTGIVALFLVQTVGNLALWFRGDELMRQAISETAALSFVILQGALFLWAAGEKLGLLPVLTLWDAATVMMTAYLAIAAFVTWRRGLAG